MSNLNTIFLANPRTEVGLTDLLYLAVAAAADGAINGADLAKGWIGVPHTWTYASANTINVPAGATSLYQKGWGVRWKQGGAYKYAYLTTVASALLTVNGGSDYTVANSAITDIAVTPNPSRAFGFPTEFNWTVSWINFTIGSAAQVAKFTLLPDRVRGYLKTTLAADSSMGTTPRFSVPVTMASGVSFADHIGRATFYDADAGLLYLAMPHVFTNTEIRLHAFNAASSYGSFVAASATVPFTWTTSDRIQIDFDYRW